MNGKIQRVKMGEDVSESARLSVCEGEARYRREGLCRCMCEGRCNPQLDVGEGVLRRKAGAERGARFQKGRGPGEVGEEGGSVRWMSLKETGKAWEEVEGRRRRRSRWSRCSRVPALQLSDAHSDLKTTAIWKTKLENKKQTA